MSIDHKELVETPEAPQQTGNRRRTGRIIAAVGVPVVLVGGGVGAGIAIASGNGHAEATATQSGHNLAVSGDICAALNSLVGHSFTVDGATATVTRVGCNNPSTIDQQANVFGTVKGGLPFDVSVNVFGDAASSVEPMASATADGYTEYLGGFSTTSQKQIYGSVTSTTVNGLPAFYETQGQSDGQSYGDAILTSDGNDDLSVQGIGHSLSQGDLVAIAGQVEGKVFVPAAGS